jgi:hypothetical protein
MSMNVETGARFSATRPRRLFPVPVFGGGPSLNNRYWDMTGVGGLAAEAAIFQTRYRLALESPVPNPESPVPRPR